MSGFIPHANNPQLGVAWRKTYLENLSSLVISHIFVGSISVISDQRVKGYKQESIRPRIGRENNVLFFGYRE